MATCALGNKRNRPPIELEIIYTTEKPVPLLVQRRAKVIIQCEDCFYPSRSGKVEKDVIVIGELHGKARIVECVLRRGQGDSNPRSPA